MRPSKQLIVTADDFGVDIAVNEAVEQAFTEGILTSASLMMGAAATDDAVARAKRLKGLAVGLHITVADGVPVSARRHVRQLIGTDGRFKDNLAGAGLRWFLNPFVRAQLAFEIEAQFKAFAATGLALDHVNVHKHLHLHPTVASLIMTIGRRYGLSALRIPYEPRGVIMSAEPRVKVARSWLGPMLASIRRRARKEKLVSNDHVFGLAWSGAMTEDRILALIPHLPPGLNELYTHPATADAASMPHAVPSYRYRDELKALLSPKVRQALNDNGVTLTRFSSSP